MTISSVRTFVTRFLFVAVIAWTLTGCDGSGAESKEPGSVDLAFTQRDSQDQTLAELGRFTVPIEDQLALQRALTREVSLKGFRGNLSYGRDGGDPNKDVVFFLLTFDGRTGTESYSGGAFQPGVGPAAGSPTGSESADMFRGTLHGFFVEGIGDRPEVPVEVVLNGSEDTERLVIDPERHMLPDRYAFQIDQSDLSPLQDIGSRSTIQVEFTRSEALVEEAGPPYGAYAVRANGRVSAGSAWKTQSVGLTYEPPLTEYEFYLLLLQP